MAAYAVLTLKELLTSRDDDVISRLIQSDSVSGFSQISHLQVGAWRSELALFRNVAQSLIAVSPALAEAGLVFEYRVPRREKRIDAVLLLYDLVVVIEFKFGTGGVQTADKAQLLDYTLDLAYYHSESSGRKIIPVLCPAELKQMQTESVHGNGFVEDLIICGESQLADVMVMLAKSSAHQGQAMPSAQNWAASAYRPIPGIIEATQALFSGHSVEDIDTALAEDVTIASSIQYIHGIISAARERKQKVLCLLTGVPGAGKTLTGMRLAHLEAVAGSIWRSVFLSGNGPLLKVLKAALASDYAIRQGVPKVAAKLHAESLIHSVHSYLAEAMGHEKPLAEQIVIFDEAQRAWDSEKMTKMANKARQAGQVKVKINGAQTDAEMAHSEPWQIFSVLNRHKDGAVIVALCGNGQEIHDGEAGVAEWVNARDKGFSDWELVCSPVAAKLAEIDGKHGRTRVDSRMHLQVPMRAHRASKHANWVDAVLAGESAAARKNIDQNSFPILITRDLDAARDWLLDTTLGTRRCGLLASSGGTRLRPYGLEVSADFRKSVDFAQWFTFPRGDLRSSFALEVAATEFECQGLELDRVCVAWSWDLGTDLSGLNARTFRGNRWTTVRGVRERQYVLNKYRVLLTRAREGMIIWIPKGRADDPTRSPEEMHRLSSYLQDCGAIPV